MVGRSTWQKLLFTSSLQVWRKLAGAILVWLWLREDKPYWFGIIGGVILFLYGIIPTMQSFPHFGRVYAAYGGIFIVLSLLWGWSIDRKTPDLYDALGAAICLVGVYLILWGPRSHSV